MLVHLVTRRVVNCSTRYPNGKSATQHRALLKCDTCDCEFERTARQGTHYTRHFCSLKCQGISQRKGGILANVKEAIFLKRYGVTVPAKAAVVKQRMMQTNIDRRGVAWPTQDVSVMAKQTDTNFQRYGIRNVFSIPETKKRANSPESCAKRHATMKHNGSYCKSKDEDLCYELLCCLFDVDDVVRQVTIPGTRWAIDFYVKSIDTYIQFDGAYWHGLDRPIEIIAEHMTKRDTLIHKKWLTDREQDEWFAQRNQRLIRITDERRVNLR